MISARRLLPVHNILRFHLCSILLLLHPVCPSLMPLQINRVFKEKKKTLLGIKKENDTELWCVFVYKWVGHRVNTDLPTRSHVALLVLAEVRRDAHTFLLRVANPALVIAQVCQVPAADAVLELPEVAPKLEILQEGKCDVFLVKRPFLQARAVCVCVRAHLQPGVPQRSAHTEPPPD